MTSNKQSQKAYFSELVIKYNTGLLEQLPKNNCATHVYRKNKDDVDVLKFKLWIEPPTKEWNLRFSNYVGMLILWLVDDEKFLIIHCNDIVSRSRTSTLLKRYKNDVHDHDYIGFHLVKAWNKFEKESYDKVMRSTKYQIVSREEIKTNRPSTNLLEANAHEEIMALLGDKSLKLTPEKCQADAGYSIDSFDRCIAIQTKSASIQPKTGVMNIFHNTRGYDGMILFCRPMTRLYIGTVIVPGSLIDKENFKLEMGEKTKYCKYLVPDVKLNDFMNNLYDAIKKDKRELIWPSGIAVDISSIIVNDFSSLCIPNFSSNITEHESQKWRRTNFTRLKYEYPKVQATTVDMIINGVKVQDKHGQIAPTHIGSNVTLTKNNGRGSNRAPYELGDFKALWVFLKDTRKFIFVISAKELEKRDYFRSETSKGRGVITCYTHDYEYKAGRHPDLWTQQYCVNTEDEDAEQQIIRLLARC